MGVPMLRVWNTSADERVCPICAPMNGPVATMVSPDLLRLYGTTEPSDVPEPPMLLEEAAREYLDATYFEPPTREEQ